MLPVLEEFFHHHHHHKAAPSAPYLSKITIKEHSMAISGVTLPTVDLTLTLPTTRTDGTALALTEIQSATILRDPGTGPATLQVMPGPFSGATATFADVSPATGTDVYSFFVTDTAGTQGVTSPSVSVTVVGVTPLAQPSAGTLTAIAVPPAGAAPVATPAFAHGGVEQTPPAATNK
jgi:hypothetical protein